MPFFDPKQPLGLPKGSVRAVIAISVIWGILALLFFKLNVPTWLVGWGGIIVGIYYGGRLANGGTQ